MGQDTLLHLKGKPSGTYAYKMTEAGKRRGKEAPGLLNASGQKQYISLLLTIDWPVLVL